MVIATAGDGKRKILMLGLSAKNVERMKANEPIHISNATHKNSLPEGMEIVIFCGETEADMYKMFKDKGMITGDTKVNIDPRAHPSV
jgi:hypothetical protein